MPRRRYIPLIAALLLLAALLGWLLPSRNGDAPRDNRRQEAGSVTAEAGIPLALPGGSGTAASAAAEAEGSGEDGNLAVRRGPFTLVEHSPRRIRIRFELPEFHIEELQREDGTIWQSLASDAPGALSVDGAPALPAWRTDIALPPGYRGKMIFTGGQQHFLANATPPPGSGPALRPEAPPECPAPSPLYYETGVWPARNAQVVAQYQMRSVAGVGIAVTPFQYDADRGGVTVMRSCEITLESDGGHVRSARLDDQWDFALLQRRQFINADQLRSDAEDGAMTGEGGAGRLLIVVPDAWQEHPALVEFAAWKRRLGYAVQLAGYPSATGESPADLKEYLQEAYDDDDRNFTHLLLLGDYQFLPPYRHNSKYSGLTYDRVASDTPYALLAGENDLEYMDAFLSRLPVPGEEQLATALARLMDNERGAVQEGWPGRGLMVAGNDYASEPYRRWGSDSGQLRDRDYLRVLADEEHLGAVMDDITSVFPSSDQLGIGALLEALEGGCSLMYYLGHGTCTQMNTTRFDSALAQRLGNGARRPFMVMPVCDNGNLDHGTATDRFHNGGGYAQELCLAEALLNPEDGVSGAAGVVAATNETYWHPPVVMMETIAEMLAGNDEEASGRPCSDGAYFLAALNDAINYCDTYYGTYQSTYYQHYHALQHAHVMHLFGDASALPRMRPYRELAVEVVNAGAGHTTAAVTAGGAPAAGVAVCLETLEGEITSGRTDSDGRIILGEGGDGLSGVLRLASPEAPVREMLLLDGEAVADNQTLTHWLDRWRLRLNQTAEADDATRQRLLGMRATALGLWRRLDSGIQTTQPPEQQQLALPAGWSPLPLAIYPDTASLNTLEQHITSSCGWNGGAFTAAAPETPGAYMVHCPRQTDLTLTGLREAWDGFTHRPGWQFVAPLRTAGIPAGAAAFAVAAGNGGRANVRIQSNTGLEPGRCYWLWEPM